MKNRIPALILVSAAFAVSPVLVRGKDPGAHSNADLNSEFRTSDRCVACHNGLKTSSGEDISIGFQWSASIMANSSRDPYWQGSVRRESIDQPGSQADIENERSPPPPPL